MGVEDSDLTAEKSQMAPLNEAPLDGPSRRWQRAKRRQVDHSANHPLWVPSAHLKDLFGLMPLDLIYEIFSHLDPPDLLNLCRTNRMLRTYLMTKRSKSVWSLARRNVEPPLPECPSDTSEPEWANLLYSTKCTVRDCTHVERIIWSLRIRACKPCMKLHFVAKRSAANRFPHVNDIATVLRALPWSTSGAYTRSGQSGGQFYLDLSILQVATIVQNFRTRIERGFEGAQTELDDFLRKGETMARDRNAAAPVLQSGEMQRRLAEYDLTRLRGEARRSAIMNRLIALGHDERDVQNISTLHNLSTEALTDDAWRKMRKGCETEVAEAKAVRLWNERLPMREARATLALQLYGRYKSGALANAADVRYPPIHYVLDSLPFKNVIESSHNDRVDEGDFAEALSSLPVLCLEWHKAVDHRI